MKKIYNGEAKTWKDVNSSWPDKNQSFSPNSSHGTYDFFEEEEWIKKISKLRKTETLTFVQSVEKTKRVSVTSVITSTNKTKIN